MGGLKWGLFLYYSHERELRLKTYALYNMADFRKYICDIISELRFEKYRLILANLISLEAVQRGHYICCLI